MSARGVGLVYRGSLEELHGAVVVSMRDCGCGRCQYLASRGESGGRVAVEVRDSLGFRDKMHHARPESFVVE